MPHYRIYRVYRDGHAEHCGGVVVKPHRSARIIALNAAKQRFPLRPGGHFEVIAIRDAEGRRLVEQSEAEKLAGDQAFRELMTV